MLNWGDKDAAECLAAELRALLRDRTLTLDQLAAIYSIKHGQSVTKKLREMSQVPGQMTLPKFVAHMAEYLELVGASQVRAVPGASADVTNLGDRVASAQGLKSSAVGSSVSAATPTARRPLGAASAAAPSPTEAPASKPFAVVKYADVSRGIQKILNEQPGPMTIKELETIFQTTCGTAIEDVVGVSTGEYLVRKESVFQYNAARETVSLQSAVSSGTPAADSESVKDEAFVVKEFEQLIEVMGPVVYISTLCGKFIQRNGTSVTSIISTRPLDLFKRHPESFVIVGAGNVTLKKYEALPEVARLIDKPSTRAPRAPKPAEEVQLPVPETITEQHVVDEFRRLILSDAAESVYISSLCGRFLQRFKKPVTAVIPCKPAEFLRKYPDIFVMTGGGNVGLREVLGPYAVSVPPPPPRVPKMFRDDVAPSDEEFSDDVAGKVPSASVQGSGSLRAAGQHEDDEEYHDGEDEDEDEDFHDADEG